MGGGGWVCKPNLVFSLKPKLNNSLFKDYLPSNIPPLSSFPSTGVPSFPIFHTSCHLCSVPPSKRSLYLLHQQETLNFLSSIYPACCDILLQEEEVLSFPSTGSTYFPIIHLHYQLLCLTSQRSPSSSQSSEVTPVPIIKL